MKKHASNVVAPFPRANPDASSEDSDADSDQLPPIDNGEDDDDDDDASAQEGVPPLANNAPLAPPPYEATENADEVPRDRPQIKAVSLITEQEARDALLQRCTNKCCYGSRAAREMTVTALVSTSALHYILETFGETRSTTRTFSVYGGGPIDGPANGPTPQPWDVPAYATENYTNETRTLVIPHSASVKPCHNCDGSGQRRCSSCRGNGRTACWMCDCGIRIEGNERRLCSSCNGTGVRLCGTCAGRGVVICKMCNGCGQLVWFTELNVVWINHKDDFILNASALPDKKIPKAVGETAFEEERPRVFPLNNCAVAAINQASTELVSKHQTKYFTSEKILTQRHRLRIVPVTEVGALWKEKPFKFFVYGHEHRVYTEDYPQRCCCCCSIL